MLFDSIAGIFGATQQARSAKQAAQILNANREQAMQWAGQYDQMSPEWMDMARAGMGQAQLGIDESRAVGAPTQIQTGYESQLANLMARAQGMDVGQGLSGADMLAVQDAQRLLNENMAATGNLRSGAAGFANQELLRRVVADANQRRFEREFNKAQLLFGGQQAGATQALQGWQLGLQRQGQLVNQALARANANLQGAQLASGIGQNYAQMGYGMRNAALGMAPAMAAAEQNKGAAFANQIGAFGQLGGDVLNMAGGALMGGLAPGMAGITGGGWSGAGMGAMMGGQNLMQMNFLQQLLNRQQPAASNAGKYTIIGQEGGSIFNNQGGGFGGGFMGLTG